jgi:hypothetical protein
LSCLAVVLGTAVACVTPSDPVPASVHSDPSSTPLMGWSSWSFLRQDPTQAKVEAQARALKASGLLAHGYTNVNLDDFYYLDPAQDVDEYGRWVVDPSRFPAGMAALSRYVHGLGEKFGMYLTPGVPVAAYRRNTLIQGTLVHVRDIVTDTTHYETNYNFGSGRMYFIDYDRDPAAAQAFLDSWADELAGWGVDYLKLDGVGTADADDVRHWSMALAQTGRPIRLELSNGSGLDRSTLWRQYANGWRIETDVECYCSTTSYPLTDWANVAARFADLPGWLRYAGPGGGNDLDSIEVGNGADDGLTVAERQTQLTLWAIAAAPLVLGVDLTHLDPTDLALLTNAEVIAVDQRGRSGRPVAVTGQQQVWAVADGDGSYTVALFNLANTAGTVTASWQSVGFTGSAAVRDLWGRTELGSVAGSFSATLGPHASRLLRVVPTNG